MKPLGNFQGRFAAILLALLLIGPGCSKKKPTENAALPNQDQAIVDLYYNWASLSQQHNFYGMMALVYPGSNFEGMTEVCKEQWDASTEMTYSFSSVKVLYWQSNGSPYVVGNLALYQGPAVPTFYKGFASECHLLNGAWKLSGMNSNHDVDWWK